MSGVEEEMERGEGGGGSVSFSTIRECIKRKALIHDPILGSKKWIQLIVSNF